MPVQAMTPSDDERRRQADVLRGLRSAAMARAQGTPEARQWRLTPVAARINVSASQLARYESGKTLLPTTCFATVADVYGITKTELARRLGILDDAADPPVSMEADFRAAGLSEEQVQRGLQAGHALVGPSARAFAEAWIDCWRPATATQLQHPGDGEQPERQAR